MCLKARVKEFFGKILFNLCARNACGCKFSTYDCERIKQISHSWQKLPPYRTKPRPFHYYSPVNIRCASAHTKLAQAGDFTALELLYFGSVS